MGVLLYQYDSIYLKNLKNSLDYFVKVVLRFIPSKTYCEKKKKEKKVKKKKKKPKPIVSIINNKNIEPEQN